MDKCASSWSRQCKIKGVLRGASFSYPVYQRAIEYQLVSFLWPSQLRIDTSTVNDRIHSSDLSQSDMCHEILVRAQCLVVVL